MFKQMFQYFSVLVIELILMARESFQRPTEKRNEAILR